MAEEFIVLGQIPGTHFQITFAVWAYLALAGSALYLAWRAYCSMALRNAIVTIATANLLYVRTTSPRHRRHA